MFTPRYLLGLILIITSFISAFLISSASDRTISVWASSTDLAPGKIIEEKDITPVKVRLLSNAEQYLDASVEIVGTAVVRRIGAAELIPSFALSPQVDTSLQRVPIQVERLMSPVGLGAGDLVDIYGIPNQMASQSGVVSELILESVGIEEIDDSARELGGALGITLLVPDSLVSDLISTMSEFNFLLVERIS
ncbi:MAG: SAF domain-containing protein [Actinomycetales bacterium]|nr:SAF domain-containing protein [Actinomycetales bacterium]